MSNKFTKSTFALGDYKSAHHFPENRAAHLILNREHRGGVGYNPNFQSQPPDIRMVRRDMAV